MKQVLQNYRTGELSVADVPVPVVRSGGLLVRNVNSLVSAGTERQMIDLAKKSLLGKARARPDLVKQVIDKVRNEGLKVAYQQAMSRLDTPLPLGYSSAGEVVDVGSGVEEFRPGDRVACSGVGYAAHAESIFAPKNMCARIPDEVSFESAAFAALGGIALHGVRSAELTLGESVVVIGLGLLGQIAFQILKASGCAVFGVDIDPEKVALARELGIDEGAVIGQDDVPAQVRTFTRGYGADAVIVMASASSNEPIELAAEVARERAHIVATGLIGLDVPRRMFYDKELDLRIPRAWGPGIHNEYYERRGESYPLSYVRWTSQRNMEQFLHLLSRGQVRLEEIITHRFPIEEAETAYAMLTGKADERYIGVLFTYGDREDTPVLGDTLSLEDTRSDRRKGRKGKGEVDLGVIGAGQFCRGTLLPIVKKLDFVNLKGVATASGLSSRDVGDRFGFEYCTSDYLKVLEDPDVDCVMIATRHDLHAPFAIEALKHGKDVFLEKPLALDISQLRELAEVYRGSERRLMVGFNRRFSPFSTKAKELLGHSTEPMIVHCRINAGFVAKDSWIQAPEEGGGRIVGEICHFVDLIQYFAGAMPTRVYAETISNQSETYSAADNVIISMKLEGGSTASILYAANGDKSFPRERIEVFRDGSVCLIDNFRRMSFTKGGTRKRMKRANLDWGYRNELTLFFSCIKDGKELPVDFEEYVFATLTTFATVESISKSSPMDVSTVCLES